MIVPAAMPAIQVPDQAVSPGRVPPATLALVHLRADQRLFAVAAWRPHRRWPVRPLPAAGD